MVKAKDLKKTIEIMQLIFGKDARIKEVIRKINN